MKRILMISGDRSLARGDKGAFFNTLSELRKYFEKIDIICPPSNLKINSNNIFENVTIYPSSWPLIFQPLWILWQGLRLNRKHKYDVMVVHEFPPFYNGIGAILLSLVTGLKYLLEIHHIPGYPRSADLKEKIYLFLTRVFIGIDSFFANKIRVVNKQETPQFLIKAGVNRKKLIYCPSFYIDYSVFRPCPEVEKRYDFIFVARLESNKGILNLIDSIKILKKSRPGIKLLLVGKGSLLDSLKNIIKEQQLDNNIFFSDWLATSSDVAKAYCSARIFINPSFNEGGPRVLLEAMACGLPVISTPVGIAKDVINEGVNGWITDWDSQKMSSTMLKAMSSNISPKPHTSDVFEYKNAIKNYAQVINE